MKGHIRVISIVLAVGLLVWLIVAAVGRMEPRYQGRTLTQWIQLAQDYPDPEPPENKSPWRASQAAVKVMGKKAIPFLLRWGRAKDSPFKIKIIRWLRNQSWMPLNLHSDPAMWQRNLAMHGFTLLGSDAKPAIPALIEITKDKDWEHRLWAFDCLIVIRPDKETFVPVAARLLLDTDAVLKDMAAQALFALYPEEAKKLGVCEMFPELCNPPTNVVIHTH